MGERIHLLDMTCGPGGASDQTDGCATHTHAESNGQCVQQVEFDLSGPIVEDTQPVPPTVGEVSPVVLSQVHVDLWFQPDLFAPEAPYALGPGQLLCMDETAQGVLFRWCLVERDVNLPSIQFNQFANGQFDEALPTIRRGQHLWFPQTEVQYMVASPLAAGGAPNAGWGNPGETTAVCGPGAAPSGPYFPASDETGTVVGAAGCLITQKEPAPFHLKFSVKRRLVIKARKQLSLLVYWSNPWNGCSGGRAVVDWNTDIVGRITAHQVVAV